MANGIRCPDCREVMYADIEDHQPQGTWVTYACRNGLCPTVKRGYPAKERKFESK